MGSTASLISRLYRARNHLAKIAKDLARERRAALEKLKKERSQLERDDFLWHYLLESFATMGNSRGFKELIEKPDNYKRVTFDALLPLQVPDRKRVLLETLRSAKVRMPAKKAQWLVQNFDMIQEMGGLVKAKYALLSKHGREQKIEFLSSFSGIGPKYARNIMMIVYDEDFREAIAIDERIKTISKELGLTFDGYEEHERFYLDVAHDAGLNGWELDRLMYHFKDQLLDRLRAKAGI